MKQCECPLIVLCFSALMLLAGPGFGFEILLDIDNDNDPATINTFTSATNTVVKIVLNPTMPGETIGFIEFALGGTCHFCPPDDPSGDVYWGTAIEHFPEEGWVTAPGFDSQALYAVGELCNGTYGPWVLLQFEPKSGTIDLNQPMFLCEFDAWSVTYTDCPPAPHDLMALYSAYEFWNKVLLDVLINTDVGTWGQIKSIYR